jgi:hypothetical protein
MSTTGTCALDKIFASTPRACGGRIEKSLGRRGKKEHTSTVVKITMTHYWWWKKRKKRGLDFLSIVQAT